MQLPPPKAWSRRLELRIGGGEGVRKRGRGRQVLGPEGMPWDIVSDPRSLVVVHAFPLESSMSVASALTARHQASVGFARAVVQIPLSAAHAHRFMQALEHPMRAGQKQNCGDRYPMFVNRSGARVVQLVRMLDDVCPTQGKCGHPNLAAPGPKFAETDSTAVEVGRGRNEIA